MKTARYYRPGCAPYTSIPGPISTDRAWVSSWCREANKYGEYRGRGVKVYPCDENGRIILPTQRVGV